MLETLKNLFRSKKKKLILDIKKKHKKNITDNDINDYRRKHKKYSNSDNDILMLILSEDIEIKSAHPRNTEKVELCDSVVNCQNPVTTSTYSSSSSSIKSSKSSRKDDDYYSSSNSSNYDSGSSYHSNSYCSGSSSSSSSSDCGSSSSCD